MRAQLKGVPTMPATVIAERVGWTRGMTVFTERVRELRPACLPPEPASRTTHVAVTNARVNPRRLSRTAATKQTGPQAAPASSR